MKSCGRGWRLSVTSIVERLWLRLPVVPPMLLFTASCGGIRIQDIQTHRPIPPGACLAVGFLGGRDAWDDETKGVRRLALDLRKAGIFAETFENRSRDLAFRFVHEAMAGGGGGRRLVLFGQSFGGAAVVKLARELEVEVDLTVLIDSVGRGDGMIPANVRSAANLYQEDGWFLRGEHPITAADSSRTRILGNWRFDYSEPPGSDIPLDDVPWWKLAFRIPHARMDRDPRVWESVRELIEAACHGSGG